MGDDRGIHDEDKIDCAFSSREKETEHLTPQGGTNYGGHGRQCESYANVAGSVGFTWKKPSSSATVATTTKNRKRTSEIFEVGRIIPSPAGSSPGRSGPA
jgi:hypothetical protein